MDKLSKGFTEALKELVVNLKTSNEMLQSYIDSVNGVRGFQLCLIWQLTGMLV